MEFFPQDMNISKMNDVYIFGEKADTCKEFSCHRSSHGDLLNPVKQSAVGVSEVQSIRKVDKNDMSMDKDMAAIQTSSFVVSPDTYKTLLENLYIARLSLLRATNITMNQLNVYKEEAIEHMQEIKRIIREELENPEASAESLAQELVKVGTEVIRSQQALNKKEMEELVNNLESLLNTLRSDVKQFESLAEPEYEEKSKQRSYTELIFDYGHWCLFVLYVSIVLSVGLSRYLPAFEKNL